MTALEYSFKSTIIFPLFDRIDGAYIIGRRPHICGAVTPERLSQDPEGTPIQQRHHEDRL